MKKPASLKEAFAEFFETIGSMFAGVLGLVIGIVIIGIIIFLAWKFHKWYFSLKFIWKILLGIPLGIVDLMVLAVICSAVR